MSHSQRLRIVVGGFLGLIPTGGVTWDYIQYPLGLLEMGHDVYYVEDTCQWPVFQTEDSAGRADIEYVQRVMSALGLGERWAYRDEATKQCYGLSAAAVHEICATADVLVNLSCSTVSREEYQRIPVRVLIDTDPMFTQIQLATHTAFTSASSTLRQLVDAHTHHFTYGENIGAADCLIPDCGIRWLPTRQPICMNQWSVSPLPDQRHAAYTTVMNWTAGRPLEYQGERWGQKSQEWHKIEHIAAVVPELKLAVAVSQTTGEPFPAAEAERLGWNILDPRVCASDWKTYQNFIQQSRGELSVAKQTYVKARTGWFSGRSACYLASGRPVITQDTGWSRHFPHGLGLLAFDDRESAIAALQCVEADPHGHATAAREIAETYFASDRVLSELLADAGVT